MTEDRDDTDGGRKERSPSFPFIPLPKAVDRASAMAEAHKRSHARLATVGETWGYGPKSSGLLQTVAALKAYGLITDIGGGTERRIQISDLGWRILQDSRPGAREQALREAALRPRLIAEYAESWLPDRPNDSHCLSELTLDRGFTPDAAKLFLRVFDETASYANLKNDDSLSANLLAASEERAAEESGASRVSAPTAAPTVSAPMAISFLGDRIEVKAILVSQESVEKLIAALQATKALLPPEQKPELMDKEAAG